MLWTRILPLLLNPTLLLGIGPVLRTRIVKLSLNPTLFLGKGPVLQTPFLNTEAGDKIAILSLSVFLGGGTVIRTYFLKLLLKLGSGSVTALPSLILGEGPVQLLM